jgi:hypothetical protein
MGERDGALVLVNPREHLQKYLLGKVFLSDPSGKMGADDAGDERMQVLHKFPCSNLIAFPNAIKAASQVKRLVVRHIFMEAASYTLCKTAVGGPRLPSRRILDILRPWAMNSGQEMAPAKQALRLTSAHDL